MRRESHLFHLRDSARRAGLRNATRREAESVVVRTLPREHVPQVRAQREHSREREGPEGKEIVSAHVRALSYTWNEWWCASAIAHGDDSRCVTTDDC